MIVFAIITGIVILLLALILTMPAHLGIEYDNLDGKQKLVLHIRLLLLPLKINIPVLKDAEKKKKQKKEKPKEKMTLTRFRSAASGFRTAYHEAKDEIKDILADIRHKAEFETITFRLGFGLSNAAKTGIATGAAWASSSCILSVLDHMFGIRQKELDVSPDFNREYFHLYIKSILRLRPVHIINISIRIIRLVNLFIEKMDIK